MSWRFALVGSLTLAACSDDASRARRPSPLETAIARELTARLQAPVSTSCAVIANAARCEAHLLDGTRLPLAVDGKQGEWHWRITALVVDTTPIASHVNATLADLKLARRASCGARIQVLQAGDRISCMIEGGGMAFVQVAGDGTTSLELALDRASAAARMELVTPERDRELTRMSADLEMLEGESDGEEEVPGDGGVASP